MKLRLFGPPLLPALLLALAFSVGSIPMVPAGEPAPPPVPKAKADPKGDSPLPTAIVLEGEEAADYLAEVKVRNVPLGSTVLWDVTPEGQAKIRIIKTEKSLLFAGPPGSYDVRVRIVQPPDKDGNDNVTDLRKTVLLTQKVVPPVPPGPGPGPLPPPVPTPTGKFSYFVVVEDTLKAQQWRGELLGSPLVHAAYNILQGSKTDPVHRLIDIQMEATTPEIEKFQKLAVGKELPWMFFLDENHKVIDDKKAPLDAQAFAIAITNPVPHQRAMGNIPPPENKLKFAWQEVGTPNVPMIDRDKWKEADLSVFLPAVKDQDGVGACNAFATITCVEAARKQAGLKYIRLSPGYLYGNINGGSDNGSLLEDALAWMTENGTCETTIIGDLDWRGGRRKPAAAVTNAKQYRILEAYLCPNFAAMASALQQGFFINEGLLWYDNFTPDRDGWLPSSGRGGAGGHALCGYGLAKRTLANGTVQWGIKTRNSWSASWGVGGNCVIPESLFGKSIGGFWAVRAVSSTPTQFSTTQKFDFEKGFDLAATLRQPLKFHEPESAFSLKP